MIQRYLEVETSAITERLSNKYCSRVNLSRRRIKMIKQAIKKYYERLRAAWAE